MLSSNVYQALFERSPIPEYLTSPSADPIILAANDAFVTLVGRSRESLVGTRLFEAFPGDPDDPQQTALSSVTRSFERVIATGKSDELELQRYPIRVPGPNGKAVFEERYWSAVNTPIFDESGVLACISHRTRDVTELWRMQESLRRSEERKTFQLALADRLRPLVSPREIVGAALELLAQRLKVARLMYAEIDEASGTFLIRNEWVAPGHFSIAHESRPLDDFGPGVVAALRAGRAMVVHDVAADPGTREHAQAYAAIGVRANLAIPLVKCGTLTNVLSIHHDRARQWSEDDVEIASEVAERTWAAAEQARAQQALHDSERAFRVLADAVPQIIWITDNDGNSLFFNRQWHEYTGHPRDDDQSTADAVSSQFVHPEDRELTMSRFDEARRLGSTFSVEHRIRRADGVYRWFLVRAEPERHPQTGEICRWFGSSTDIGALKEAEQALRQADRRKDEFLATLAHELRNPLAPVTNAIAMLRSPRANEQTRARMLDLMERQARHLVRLVDDLLEVSRITSGKIHLQLQRLDLRTIAQACVDAASSEIVAARHEVSLRLPAQPVWVHADQARMQQVIDNLLNNAIKYTPAGGVVELEVGYSGEHGQLKIKDNGLGIPSEMLGDVFELFAQVNQTIGRSNGGLGIGLALVKQLVLLHGGQVQVASDGIGTGSTFVVQVPLANPETPADDVATGSVLQQTRQTRRVLVIDDNRDAADTIAAALELAGHEVGVAYDGAAGLAAADRVRPECILLDLGMPGMNGHQVARSLRSNPDHGRCLLVALTGWGQQHDRASTRQSGFDAHLVKPASIEAILELLEVEHSAAAAGYDEHP